MNALKPCPFCGSYKFRIERYGKNKNSGYRIICDSRIAQIKCEKDEIEEWLNAENANEVQK